jgi:hypothetical protein
VAGVLQCFAQGRERLKEWEFKITQLLKGYKRQSLLLVYTYVDSRDRVFRNMTMTMCG